MFEGGLGAAVKILSIEEDETQIYADLEIIAPKNFIARHYPVEPNEKYVQRWVAENRKTVKIYAPKEQVSINEKRGFILFMKHVGIMGGNIKLFYNKPECVRKVQRQEEFGYKELWGKD